MYSSKNKKSIYGIQKTVLICVLVPLVFLTINSVAQNINTPNKKGPLGTQVNTFTGNLFIPRNDIYIPARGFDINIEFNYNSYNYNQQYGFGKGWSFGYSIQYKNDTANSKTIIWGDGREDNYTPLGGGAFKSPKGVFNTFSEYQAGKFLLTESGGTKFFFDNSIHKRITRTEEPNNNFINFNYTGSLLTSLVNTAGQTISFTYNAAGLLATVIDAITSPTRTYTYTYDAAGNLKQVTDPLGGTNKYTYLVNGPMKTIADKNNNTVDIIYYPGFAASELIGCNKRVSFSYDSTTNITAITDHLTDGNNQVTKYGYKKYEDKVWLTSITGNCCGYNLSFEFDANGNKIKETDANGNITTYTYDSLGNMLTMKDPLNQTITYTYSANFSNITSFTDAKGFVTTMIYDGAGNLTQLTEPGNLVYTTIYNPNGDLISSTDPKGNIFTYNYDSYGNPGNVTGPNGYNALLGFDARGNLLSFTDARGNTRNIEYDILNRLKKITDPINNNIRFNYDAEGNTVSLINENNESTLMTYDASNRVVQITDVLGNKGYASYDAMNNMTSITNEGGHQTKFSFDTRNRLTGITDQQGNKSEVNYDANGNITSINLPNGQVFTYTFDPLNRMTSVNDINGPIANFIYDKNNNITSYTNGTGAIIYAEYDSLSRIKKVTDPLGNSYLLTYDKNSNLITTTDWNGFTSTFTYDSLDRVKTLTDKNGFIVTVTYDAQGNIISLKDQNNNITSYTYDNLNRVKRTTYPDGLFMEYTYNNKGNITVKRLTDGSNITFTYDSLNRIISKALPGGDVYSYTYDALGRVLSATNNAGTVSITYDVLNRISSETYNGRTVNYAYNITGRTQTTIYPDSTVITKNYDTRSRLISISRNNMIQVSFQYNNLNQLTGKTFANGVTTNLQYDFANRLSNISTGGGTIQNSNFTYDKNNNKISINRVNVPAQSEQFTYDNGNRLTNYKRGVIGGSPIINNTYTYDALGNRINAILNGVNTVYTSNNLNQLTNSNNGAQNINYTYDNNGNLTYDGRYYKTYDAQGRLLKDSASVSNMLTYQYDAFGRRVQQNKNGNILNYTFSGLKQIEERDGSGAILNKTIFSNFLKPVTNEKNGVTYFYHPNELNSVEALTNDVGMLMEKYGYDVYGKQTIYDSLNNILTGSITGNRFGFTGQVYDSATASNKFLFREYNPETGLFNERDLLGYDDGMGMYQYVGDNPANGIDIFGLKKEDCPPVTSSSMFGSTITEKSIYAINFTSSISAIIAISDDLVSPILKAPLLNILFTPVSAYSTYNTASELSQNWSSKSYGQQVDGIISVGSGGVSTITGGLVSATIVGGTAGEMLFGGASFSAALGTSVEAGGALFSIVGGFTAGGVIVATGGGLAIAGLVNEFSKFTTGKSLSEHGENTYIPIVDDLIVGYQQLGPKESVNEMMRKDKSKYEIARRKVELRGSRGGSGPAWIKPGDCPPNGGGGGTLKPGSPGGGTAEPVTILRSSDPNEIIGPIGQPALKWVSVKDRLPYTVLYENDKSASAPAKYVRITSSIEPKQDAATFQLGSFGFNSLTFGVPPNTASYYQRLDVRDSLGLFVDIIAGYDQINNVAFWEFQSIDPITLLPPSDPLKGFLLLQDSLNLTYGHGFVNFSIKPVQSALTSDTIGARASIVFDINDTIPTNIHTNTIDAFAPTSHMNALPPNSNNPVALSWNGTDDTGGCGIYYYTIYVSTDQVNYSVLIPRTTRTDTTISLPPDSSYCFFVLATDSVGNKETLRQGEIRCSYIGPPLPVTWLYFKGKTVAKDNILDWATANEQNSKQFDVERSLNGTTFSRVGIVHAAGNSNQTNSYQYTDYNIDRLKIENMFYRLKQIDINGTFRYSNIVKLAYKTTDEVNSVVYPNPTQGSVTILVGNNSLVGTVAVLYDVNGRLLDNIKITTNSQPVNLSKYVNGTYFIKLNNNEVLKIVKQ